MSDAPTQPSITAAVLGRTVTIVRESGTIGHGTLRAFRVREFPGLIPLLAHEERLIERSLGVAEGNLVEGNDPITPDSYDALARAFHEINAPFFNACARKVGIFQMVNGPAVQQAMADAMRKGPSNSASG